MFDSLDILGVLSGIFVYLSEDEPRRTFYYLELYH